MHDILVNHVSFAFEEKTVIRNLSFVISRGSVTCLMAPSGAGKTTFIRLLLGLLKPQSGSIIGLDQYRLACVFQEDRLIEDMDASSNILLVAKHATRDNVSRAMDAMELHNAIHQPVRELSGGMRRRVALLRALLSEWDLLIMDEPFSGLDEDTRNVVIRETLARINNRTVFMVTHNVEEARAMHANIIQLQNTFSYQS